MLQQGFSADSADYDGRTALMLAAAKGHADVAVALISAGADVMLRDNLKRKPLLEACVYGHSEIIELLTRQGATCAQLQYLSSKTSLTASMRDLNADARMWPWPWLQNAAAGCTAAAGSAL